MHPKLPQLKQKKNLDQAIDEPPESFLSPPDPEETDHWCLVGQEKGINKCALVKNANQCMTGQSYLSEMECMKTKHYEMIPSPYQEPVTTKAPPIPVSEEKEKSSFFSFFSF